MYAIQINYEYTIRGVLRWGGGGGGGEECLVSIPPSPLKSTFHFFHPRNCPNIKLISRGMIS